MDVFLLGAGFSKAAAPQLPTMSELATSLFEGVPLAAKYIDENGSWPTQNLESWLDHLATDQPQLARFENLENRALFLRCADFITAHIRDRQHVAYKSTPPVWLTDLVSHWHRHRAPVVTLNYDTIVEATMSYLTLKNDGESGRARGDDAFTVRMPNVNTRFAGTWGGDRHETLQLMKLHGSTNWLRAGRAFADTVYNVQYAGHWGDHEPSARFADEVRAYASDLEPLIVPPSFAKAEFLNNSVLSATWRNARAAFRQASRIICFGYSMPSSDTALRTLVLAAQPGTKLVCVNRDEAAGAHFATQLPGISIDDSFLGDGAIESFCSTEALGRD